MLNKQVEMTQQHGHKHLAAARCFLHRGTLTARPVGKLQHAHCALQDCLWEVWFLCNMVYKWDEQVMTQWKEGEKQAVSTWPLGGCTAAARQAVMACIVDNVFF
jgi:hypothetical protein